MPSLAAAAASRARSACLQPASCNRSSNHLASMQMPYHNPANGWRSARERHDQNDVMPGVRRYDLSGREHLPAVPYYSCCAGRACRTARDRGYVRSFTALWVNLLQQRRGQRRCPRPMPRIPALRRSARSVRLIFFAISGSGVRAFECVLSSRTSSFVHGAP
jgi:hypothetical protein